MKNKKKNLSLYIHVPFCVQKCFYCDFHSAPAQEGEKQRYIQLLCREIAAWADITGAEYRLETVFIGGGTPTCLSVPLFGQVCDAVFRHFDCSGLTEFTVEANPGTVTGEYARIFREKGVNRVSLGLQSSRDEELKRLGRIHNYQEFLTSYEMLRGEGIPDINVDLMTAVPGQDLESCRDTLQRVAALGPEHISVYSLIVEEGTVFAEWEKNGTLDRPDEETERDMYYLTGEYLSQQGYERYEISNYARPGKECRHNCVYWTGGEYLGLGENAASYLGEYRFCVPAGLRSYEKYVDALEAGNSRQPWLSGIACDVVRTDATMQMEEYMFLGLRMMRGISCREFHNRFGRQIGDVYGKTIERLVRLGLLERRGTGDVLALTGRGIDVSNRVLAEFLLEERE